MLNLPTAARLLRQVLPDDEIAALARWIEVARNLSGEASEIRALLSTALATGLVTEETLKDIGLVETSGLKTNQGRVVVLRRHGQPGRTGHLSDAGRAACGLLSKLSFDRILSSDLPRSVETAIALGGEGQDVFALLRPPPPHIEAIVGSHRSFSHWTLQIQNSQMVAVYCLELVDLLLDLAGDGRSLIISHDDTIQAIAAGMLGEKASGLGRSLGHLEGIALIVDESKSGVRLGSPPC